ncbi:MAG: hypothetical protein KDE19_02060 [Caldilineaceae bacterium]|nr:hypothetical protein [Caldilineaceae bacterium]
MIKTVICWRSFFQKGPATNAVELADPIILRYNRETGLAMSLSILTFSKVVEKTTVGPRSFRLSGLDRLPEPLRELVSNLITTPPVSTFLKVSS